MTHKLVRLIARDNLTDKSRSHDWVANCCCGWESNPPREVFNDARADYYAHERTAA